MCDRHFGVGADGVIFALTGGAGGSYRMRMYNSDGSDAEMCGNGIRCLARFLKKLEDEERQCCGGAAASADAPFMIETLAGIIRPVVQASGTVAVSIGFLMD